MKVKENLWETIRYGRPDALINDETKVCKDICRCKEYVKVPDICKVPMDWNKAEEDTRRIHEEGKLTMAMMASGLFEQSHALMGLRMYLLPCWRNRRPCTSFSTSLWSLS